MQIKLDNINYIYNKGTAEEIQALKNVNLNLGGDSFTAIIGSTGSGKSTLIQLLNGLLKPTSGRIAWDDKEIYGLKDEKKLIRDIRCRVGLCFQYPEYQLFETDVYADVAFGPKNQGNSNEEIDRKVRWALNAVGYDESGYKKSPLELSGGLMRRVAIAGILAMEPDIVVLDEPTAGLDPLGKKEILGKLKDIQRSTHASIILVSHSMEEVAAYADRVIAMHKGEVILDGETHEVFSHREELRRIGLEVPEVTSFYNELTEAGQDSGEYCATARDTGEAGNNGQSMIINRTVALGMDSTPVTVDEACDAIRKWLDV